MASECRSLRRGRRALARGRPGLVDFRAGGSQGALPWAPHGVAGGRTGESKPGAPRVQEAAERKSGISMAVLEFWAAMLGIIRAVELYDAENGERGIERPLLVRAVSAGPAEH